MASAWAAPPVSKPPSFDSLFNLSPLSSSLRQHILRVYLTLAAGLASVAVGAYASWHVQLGYLLSTFGCVALYAGVGLTPKTPQNQTLRLNLLLGGAFLQGCSLGPLLNAVADIDSSIISVAVAGAAAVFAAFSGAALLAKRREYLYLGGLCGSALSLMLTLRLASFIFGTSDLQFQIMLYLGLLVFSGYVIYDTQVMIERAASGTGDYVSDALTLLLDFVAIFVRILIILAQKGDGNKGDKKKKQRR